MTDYDCGTIKFLFWNIHRNQKNIELVTRFGVENDIDIIALCETGSLIDDQINGYEIVKHIATQDDINVFCRKMRVIYTRERTRYCILRAECGPPLIFAVVHLNSDMFSSGKQYRQVDIDTLCRDLSIEESKNGKNTFVIGDFNDNLFSDVVFGFTGLNVRVFKSSVESPTVRLHESEKDVFYNPMLNVYKDYESESIANGTYYYHGDSIQWLCYDQIMMKEPLINRFVSNRLKIINKMCDVELVRNYKPDPRISDHMPIYCEFTKEGK